MTVVGTKL